jgi:hypothetical protein
VPFPGEAVNIAMRVNILPPELVDDEDRPRIVGDLVTRCLLPIAREKWGVTYKKFTGGNQGYLIREGKTARAILANLAKPQKRSSGGTRLSIR